MKYMKLNNEKRNLTRKFKIQEKATHMAFSNIEQ